MADEQTDDTAPMPADFAATSHEEVWKRLRRERSARARVEADLEMARGRMAELEPTVSEVTTLRQRLAEQESAAAAARAEAERYAQRIPLIRAGIEDDDVAGLLVERWRASQGAVEEAKRKALDVWLREDAAADKIASRLLPAAPAAPQPPPPAPNLNRGAEVTTTSAPTRKITQEEYERDRASGRGITELMRQYYVQEQWIRPEQVASRKPPR